jgi:hypothetical protein
MLVGIGVVAINSRWERPTTRASRGGNRSAPLP